MGPCGFDTGQPKSVEGGGAVIKKEDIGPGPLAMPGINSFILAVQNPEAVKNGWHTWHCGSLAELGDRSLAIVQRNAGEWPNVRTTSRAVDAIPAIDEESMAGAG